MISSLFSGSIFQQISSISFNDAGEITAFSRVLIESGIALLGISFALGLFKRTAKNTFKGRENVIPIQIDEIRREMSGIEHEEKEETVAVPSVQAEAPVEKNEEEINQKKETEDIAEDKELQVKAVVDKKAGSNEEKKHITKNSKNRQKNLILKKLLNIERSMAIKDIRKKISSVKAKKLIVFELDYPAARSVALTGDFNGWCTDSSGNGKYWPLVREVDGVWRTLYYLAPGNYGYKFVIDGKERIPDPANNMTFGDGMGGMKSIIEV